MRVRLPGGLDVIGHNRMVIYTPRSDSVRRIVVEDVEIPDDLSVGDEIRFRVVEIHERDDDDAG